MNLNMHNVHFGLLSTQWGNRRFLLMTNFLSEDARSSLAQAIADAFDEDGYDVNNFSDARVVFGSPRIREALEQHPLMQLFGPQYVGVLINTALLTVTSLYNLED